MTANIGQNDDLDEEISLNQRKEEQLVTSK
jgi:hypothetical protein